VLRVDDLSERACAPVLTSIRCHKIELKGAHGCHSPLSVMIPTHASTVVGKSPPGPALSLSYTSKEPTSLAAIYGNTVPGKMAGGGGTRIGTVLTWVGRVKLTAQQVAAGDEVQGRAS
jgi:hypothetical protein